MEGPPDWLLTVDFLSGHDAVELPPKMLLYNAALGKRHGLRVRSMAAVLHPGAHSPQLNGVYERGFPGEPPDVTLRYKVVRVWEVPPEQWLTGGLGTVPLAPLGAVREAELPAVIDRMKERFEREAPRGEAADLWFATQFLMNLRYEGALIQSLLQGATNMEESEFYQNIICKGKAEGLREAVLLVGRSRFGEPSAEAVTVLTALTDVEKLEELTARSLQVSSWQELLGLMGPSRRGRGRKKSS